MAHISPCSAEKAVEPQWDAERGVLTVGPRAVLIRHEGGALTRGGGPRSSIRQFSRGARQRLIVALAQVVWPERPYALTTVTYPGEWPDDPAVWKRDLDTLRKRYERKFGPLFAVWVLEFQRRGAPHFHLVMGLPDGVRLYRFQRWLSLAWYQVVGSGDERHAAAGTQVKLAHGAMGAAGYLHREIGKERQKVTPDYVLELHGGPGRFWGMWNVERSTVDVDLSRGEFFALRRALRRLARARGYRYYQGHRTQGLTVFQKPYQVDAERSGWWHAPPDWSLAAALARWIGPQTKAAGA